MPMQQQLSCRRARDCGGWVRDDLGWIGLGYGRWTFVAPWSNDAAESDVTCRRVDRLRVTRGRAVAAAVVRRAQMRAAFGDLARNFNLRLAGVVAAILFAAAWILRNAARLRRVSFMLGGPPIGGPLPDIADHVVDAVAVGRKRHHRRGTIETIFAAVFVREISLPGIGAMLSAGRKIIAPSEFGAIEAAARGELPFRFSRQIFARPFCVGECVGERDVYYRMIV